MKKIKIKIVKFTWQDIEKFKRDHPDKPKRKRRK